MYFTLLQCTQFLYYINNILLLVLYCTCNSHTKIKNLIKIKDHQLRQKQQHHHHLNHHHHHHHLTSYPPSSNTAETMTSGPVLPQATTTFPKHPTTTTTMPTTANPLHQNRVSYYSAPHPPSSAPPAATPTPTT